MEKNIKKQIKFIEENMEIVEVHNRTGNLINELVEILEDSVRATHTFLANEEIEKIIKNPELMHKMEEKAISKSVKNVQDKIYKEIKKVVKAK